MAAATQAASLSESLRAAVEGLADGCFTAKLTIP
jgi:hypothetical protein